MGNYTNGHDDGELNGPDKAKRRRELKLEKDAEKDIDRAKQRPRKRKKLADLMDEPFVGSTEESGIEASAFVQNVADSLPPEPSAVLASANTSPEETLGSGAAEDHLRKIHEARMAWIEQRKLERQVTDDTIRFAEDVERLLQESGEYETLLAEIEASLTRVRQRLDDTGLHKFLRGPYQAEAEKLGAVLTETQTRLQEAQGEINQKATSRVLEVLEERERERELQCQAEEKRQAEERECEQRDQRLGQAAEIFLAKLATLQSALATADAVTGLLKESCSLGLMQEGFGSIVWEREYYGATFDVASVVETQLFAFLQTYRTAVEERRRDFQEKLRASMFTETEIAGAEDDFRKFWRDHSVPCANVVVSYYVGEKRMTARALIERIQRDGKEFFVCQRVNRLDLARLLFSTGEREPAYKGPIRFSRGTAHLVEPKFFSRSLLYAIEYRHQSEVEADPEFLLDLARVPERIDFGQLAGGEKGTTVINASLREGQLICWLEGSGPKDAVHPACFRIRLVSKGAFSTFSRNLHLGEYMEWRPVSDLDERHWRFIRYANAPYERDMELAEEARRRKATLLTSENFQDLLGIEGKGGLYAMPSYWDSGERSERPLAYVVERKGQEIRVVWSSMKGISGKVVSVGGKYLISDLPDEWGGLHYRVVFANSYILLARLDKETLPKGLPDHLLPKA